MLACVARMSVCMCVWVCVSGSMCVCLRACLDMQEKLARVLHSKVKPPLPALSLSQVCPAMAHSAPLPPVQLCFYPSPLSLSLALIDKNARENVWQVYMTCQTHSSKGISVQISEKKLTICGKNAREGRA